MAWRPDYATTAELKDYLRIGDTVDDTELALTLTAASRIVDRATNRQFGVVGTAEQRYYPSRWDRRRGLYVVEIDDLSSTTGFVVTGSDGNTVAAEVTAWDGGYVLEPRNASQLGVPWTQFVVPSGGMFFTVAGLWGWAAVPDTIKQATLLQAARINKRRDAPFGVAGSPDSGSEVRLLNKIDPDVEVMIGPYRRWWAAT